MSETKSDEPQSQPEAAEANVPPGAVDTGRRIDPALLKGGAAGAGPRTIRRGRPEDNKPEQGPGEQPEAPAEAQAPAGDQGTA